MWPMTLLAVNVAISNEFAGGAYLQFYAIRRCFVTVSTYFVRLFVSVGIIAIVYIIWTATNHEQRDIKEHHEADK
jgi:ethanolamine transporter EutH